MLLGGAAVAAAGARDKRMSRGGKRRRSRLAASSFSIMRNIRRCQSRKIKKNIFYFEFPKI